jgi:hypothetical protein
VQYLISLALAGSAQHALVGDNVVALLKVLPPVNQTLSKPDQRTAVEPT